MPLTPDARAEIEARMKPRLERLRRQRSLVKPKVVVSDGMAVRDADVIVSRADPNSRGGEAEVVSVRRADHVVINMAVAETQFWDRQQAASLDKADPFGMGHWGAPRDE